MEKQALLYKSLTMNTGLESIWEITGWRGSKMVSKGNLETVKEKVPKSNSKWRKKKKKEERSPSIN